MKLSEQLLRETRRPQFPQFSLRFKPGYGSTLILSTGHELHLGYIHDSALEDLFLAMNLINGLAVDPKMISKERISSQLN